MRELKTIYAEDTFDEDYMEYHHSDKRYYREVYIKSEADKYILKLKADLVRWEGYAHLNNGERLREIIHHKHKRCLAMAKMCAKNVDHLNAEGYIYEKEGQAKELADCIKGTEFYDRWYHRWLELAEVFK